LSAPSFEVKLKADIEEKLQLDPKEEKVAKAARSCDRVGPTERPLRPDRANARRLVWGRQACRADRDVVRANARRPSGTPRESCEQPRDIPLFFASSTRAPASHSAARCGVSSRWIRIHGDPGTLRLRRPDSGAELEIDAGAEARTGDLAVLDGGFETY
jgi:hypothetical protein